MKLKLLLLIFFFNFFSIYVFSQKWIWAESGTGWPSINNEGSSIATDPAGNVYALGYFSSISITFGSFVLNNPPPAPGGTISIFLVKYDPNGNVLWAKNFGLSNNNNQGLGITVDASSNVFITGMFASSIKFDLYTLVSTAGAWNAFLVKLDTNGIVLWARSAGGAMENRGMSVSADPSGNVFLVGNFYSPVLSIGPYTFNNADVTGATPDIFIAKYDGSGNVVWAKSLGGTAADFGYGVAADPFGNMYITGGFFSTLISFGSVSFTNADITNTTSDMFLAKCDPLGAVIWATKAGGLDYENGLGVVSDISGNVCVTGGFQSSSISFGKFIVNNRGMTDVFTVKYNSSGSVLWAKGAGSVNADWGAAIASDNAGNIFVLGAYWKSEIVFGMDTLYYPASSGIFPPDPIFIVKYDKNGNELCASALSSGGNSGLGIATDAAGDAFIIGDYENTPFIVGPDSLQLVGEGDIYVAKYRCCDLAVSLTSDTTISFGQASTLNASGGGSYIWSNGMTDSTIIVSPASTTQYCINVKDSNGCAGVAFVTVNVVDNCTVENFYIPNAFSPNGDDENDFLQIYYENLFCISSFSLSVFDRWGEKIFETEDPLFKWDGAYRGLLMNTQVVVYFLKADFITEKGVRKKGNISLIR